MVVLPTGSWPAVFGFKTDNIHHKLIVGKAEKTWEDFMIISISLVFYLPFKPFFIIKSAGAIGLGPGIV